MNQEAELDKIITRLTSPWRGPGWKWLTLQTILCVFGFMLGTAMRGDEMAKVTKGRYPWGEVTYHFHCPGCNYGHSFRVSLGDRPVEKGNDDVWEFVNEDLESPTFTPSLLVNKDDPSTRCHLFVRDGVIEFLPDCHHALKGTKVPMEDEE